MARFRMALTLVTILSMSGAGVQGLTIQQQAADDLWIDSSSPDTNFKTSTIFYAYTYYNGW